MTQPNGGLLFRVRNVASGVALMIALFSVWLYPGTARGGNMNARWDASTSQPYPIIRVYSCLNQFKKHFPADWRAIELDLIAATNEWFVGGGAHIRLVYKGSLPDTDAACTDVPTTPRPIPVGTPPRGPTPPTGSIVVTAAPELRYSPPPRFGIGWTCEVSSTDLWLPPSIGGFPKLVGAISRARITLTSGESCSGVYRSWPWPKGLGPSVGELDYWSVLMHELGHAMGLGGENAVPSVMNTPHAAWPAFKRHLFKDDVATLRGLYGPMQSKPFHAASSTNGQSWTIPLYQPEPLSVFSLGQSACFQLSPSDPGRHYFVANTELGTQPTGTISTYITDNMAAVSYRYMLHEPSNLAPAVACGNGSYLLAYVDPDGYVQVKRSGDAQSWAFTALPNGLRSGVAPALTFVPWNGYYLIATTHPSNGSSQYLVSRDGGLSFTAEREMQYEIFRPIAIACVESIQECAAFFHPEYYLAHRELVWFDASGSLRVPRVSTGWLGSFGGTMAAAGGPTSALMMVFATAEAHRFPRQLGTGFQNNVTSQGWFNVLSYAWNIVSDSTPSVLWDPDNKKWIVWFTNYYFYNNEVGYVSTPQ